MWLVQAWIINKSLTTGFKEAWKDTINSFSKLSFYCKVKGDFKASSYLSSVTDFKARQAVTRLLTSSHKLAIERGRYTNTPRDDRSCTDCLHNGQKEIEDESHFLFGCPSYVAERNKMATDLRKHGEDLPLFPEDLSSLLDSEIPSRIMAHFVLSSSNIHS